MSDLRHERGAPEGTRNHAWGGWLAIALLLATAGGISLAGALRSVDPAPSFTLTSTGFEDGVLGDPVAFSLADYQGHVVVLDFMAVACTSCRAVTEEVLKPLAAAHPDLVLLSIDTWSDPGAGNPFGGESDADLIQLQQATNVPWRHARDTDQVYVKYAAIALPKLAVVDPDGNLVYAKAGSQDLERIEAAVQAAKVGAATPVPALRLGLGGLAFVAGLACIFTPCGIGLLPAYFALLVEDGARQPAPRRLARALGGGALATLGIVAVYAGVAAVAWGASGALRAALPWLGPVLGLVLAALGVAALAGADWSRLLGRWTNAVDGRRGFAAFGVAYALAGLACTGPLFLPILLTGFSTGVGTGATVLLLYTGAVALVVVAAAALAALGEATLLRRLLLRGAALHRASAAILVAGGLYLTWYSAKAYGLA